MRKAIVLGVLACLLAATGSSQAGLLLYDGFQYTADQKLAEWGDATGSPTDQHNVQYDQYWRYAGLHGRYGDPATVDAPHVAGGSLSVPGMPASTGNSVGFNTYQVATARIGIPGGAITGGTVYWSGMLRVNALNDLTTAAGGLMVGAFNNSTGPQETAPTSLGGLLKIRKDTVDPSAYFIGTAVNTNNTNLVWSPAQAAGDTAFVVVSYTINSGAANDVVKLWVNPNPLDFGAASEPAPTATGTVLAGSEAFAQIASYNLRNVNTVGHPDFQFDELRIGDTWAGVTPEPASLVLLALGVLALRRRRA